MTAKKKPLAPSPEDLAKIKDAFYRKYTGRPPRDQSFMLSPPTSISDILMLVFVLAIVSGIAGALLSRAC